MYFFLTVTSSKVKSSFQKVSLLQTNNNFLSLWFLVWIFLVFLFLFVSNNCWWFQKCFLDYRKKALPMDWVKSPQYTVQNAKQITKEKKSPITIKVCLPFFLLNYRKVSKWIYFYKWHLKQYSASSILATQAEQYWGNTLSSPLLS